MRLGLRPAPHRLARLYAHPQRPLHRRKDMRDDLLPLVRRAACHAPPDPVRGEPRRGVITRRERHGARRRNEWEGRVDELPKPTPFPFIPIPCHQRERTLDPPLRPKFRALVRQDPERLPPPRPDLRRLPCNWSPHPPSSPFMQKLLETTQVSQSVIVLSLHYIYRLKERNHFTRAQRGSEFRIAVAGLMMANKFPSTTTPTPTKHGPKSLGIELEEINRMEREFLARRRVQPVRRQTDVRELVEPPQGARAGEGEGLDVGGAEWWWWWW
ncbi:hypothetical protein FA13DRAFT_673392 [Coprinellus micaceus]|uniref:Uncharacterized protein n=1 Tax=Coprinellus micaceus TaxID=71717 RepID=A0A4Y7T5S5_COPMI|nr:hypothetical protein FA13DRAFT_673392 [Coprinellus micaceus]